MFTTVDRRVSVAVLTALALTGGLLTAGLSTGAAASPLVSDPALGSVPAPDFGGLDLPELDLPDPAIPASVDRTPVPPGPAKVIQVDCGKGGKLQQKIAGATAGSTLKIKGTCKGQFTITNKSLTLQGSPKATLDGKDNGTVLTVNAPGKKVTVRNLTITHGKAPQGGGVAQLGGNLVVDRSSITGNRAASPATAIGGGIYAPGTGKLTITRSSVSGNRSTASSGTALCAGIYSQGPKLVLDRSTVEKNEVRGVSVAASAVLVGPTALLVKGSSISRNSAIAEGGLGAASVSGAFVYQSAEPPRPDRITNTRISDNVAAAEGDASAIVQYGVVLQKGRIDASILKGNTVSATSTGGAAAVLGGLVAADTVRMRGTTLRSNVITAHGDTIASIQGAVLYASSVLAEDVVVAGNRATAVGALGAATSTGVVYSPGLMRMNRSTVSGNLLTARSGNSNAIAIGTMVATEIDLRASTVSGNTVTSKSSGAGATATVNGGGVYASVVDIQNSTMARNSVTADARKASATANAAGGGGIVGGGSIEASTVAGNSAKATGKGTLISRGGGFYAVSSAHLEGTIVGNNTAKQGPDCFGAPVSDGYNLIRKTGGCSFTKEPTDVAGKDPKLGPLHGNGGPTETMALLKGSPALDRIPKNKCPVDKDQRGVKRPQGKKCDIGAYELKKT